MRGGNTAFAPPIGIVNPSLAGIGGVRSNYAAVRLASVVAAMLLFWGWSVAQRVGLIGCGDPLRDHAYRDALQAHGLSIVWIAPYYDFNNAATLQACDVVVLAPLLHNLDMPAGAQSALEQWVLAGGGLVTTEWTLWKRTHARNFAGLSDLLPATATQFTARRSVSYLRQIDDPILGAGLGALLGLGYLGETQTQARSGTSVFYASDYPGGGAGVVGWQVAQGRVISLSVALGAGTHTELSHPVAARLLANAVRWAAGSECGLAQGDANRDGCVDDADLLSVLFDFGSAGVRPTDLNCDGAVDDADLLIVLFQFGAGC